MPAAKPQTLAQALVAVQSDMPAIQPDATNPHFRNQYVSLDHMLAKALPVLNKHGVALAQFPSHNELGHPTLTTILLHDSGEKLEASMPLFLPKNDPQGQGSALTYARRYALAAALGISGEKDDDGQAAVQDSGGEPRRDAGLTAASPSAASDAAASRPEPAVGGQGAVPASAPTAELPDWPQLRAELEGLLREFGGQELVDKSLPLIAKHDGDCGWATVQIAKTRANLAAKAEGKSPFQAPAGARDAA